MEKKKILVAGDICIDWLQWPIKPKDNGLQWELSAGYETASRPGGALLTAELIRSAGIHEIISPVLSDKLALSSFAELDAFPYSSDKKDKNSPVYRIGRFHGYSCPSDDGCKASPMAVDNSTDYDIVVLEDSGNGFCSNEILWPACIKTQEKSPVIIMCISHPLSENRLLELIRKNHLQKLVLIMDVENLRASGINISRCLSWEHTATDFAWQMACNPLLLPYLNIPNIIVTFGLEGAIHYTHTENGMKSVLYFDPMLAEGGFRAKHPGDVKGLLNAAVASLALKAADMDENRMELGAMISDGIREALSCTRRMLRRGFGKSARKADIALDGIICSQDEAQKDIFGEAIIPNPEVAEPPDPFFWSILKSFSGNQLEDMAFEVVTYSDGKALRNVPVGLFGKLKTVDRAEIESFRSISNLMLEYIANEKPPRPLSIAVFGFPGSGKSFGVTEVAEALSPGTVERLDLNISQFRSLEDLSRALHRVRDISLKGKLPLVFFDEFDSAFEGRLGWLKYFLMPMQDGVFKDGETIHPIGKAIFVFAGGTSHNFEVFCGDILSGRDKDTFLEEFRNAKGPDFVSRLRGYVNILGPNKANEADNVFLIRRAMLLRSMLERKVRQLFDGSGAVRIDEGVLRALLKVPYYKHGARSMEAVIEMSMLNGRTGWEQSCLPPKEQLKLHVDEEIFSRLVSRDILFGAAKEQLAMAIHEKYRQDQLNKGVSPDQPSVAVWEHLNNSLKESNYRQADNIPYKLRSIGCGFEPCKPDDISSFDFTPEELETLSRAEHESWVSERILAGWTYSPVKIVEKKLTPYLVTWEELPEDIKELDRQAVKNIPSLLKSINFRIYRK